MRISDWSSDVCSSDLDDPRVEILAAKEGIAVGGEHFELLFAIDFGNLDDRHIEGATAQIVNHDLAITILFVEAVGQRCGGRFVDDALHVQPGNAAGILGDRKSTRLNSSH